MSERSLATLARIRIDQLQIPEITKRGGAGLKPSWRDFLDSRRLVTVADLLHYLPFRYEDRRLRQASELKRGQEATMLAVVVESRNIYTRTRPLVKSTLIDLEGSEIRSNWFNQPWREDQLSPGVIVTLYGKVKNLIRTRSGIKLEFSHPLVEVLDKGTASSLHHTDKEQILEERREILSQIRAELLQESRIIPIYSATERITSNRITKLMKEILPWVYVMSDPYPAEILEQIILPQTRKKKQSENKTTDAPPNGLLDRDGTFQFAHLPPELKTDRGEITTDITRSRLVFDEFFRLLVLLALRRRHNKTTSVGIVHRLGGQRVTHFSTALFTEEEQILTDEQNQKFVLTKSQKKVIREIGKDLKSNQAMQRLLQGDVGSGKTLVALHALLTTIDNGFQGAIMAPTEVLAGQHFITFTELLGRAGMNPQQQLSGSNENELTEAVQPVRVVLLTGSTVDSNYNPEIKRREVLADIEAGQVDIVIGTHALIQEGVEFTQLGLAVVDEQHRFGALQRATLRGKGGERTPDLLIMTATPIPRTLALTLYGDVDVSTIDELPPGRTPIKTSSFDFGQERQVWEKVRAEVSEGRQVFVVCPLVEESAQLQAASAVAEQKRLEKLLAPLQVDLIHGQMRSERKQKVMADFRAHQFDVLVATTVIEVGIDIPNATVMVIENADRFGLSQLHQLRGRVGRGRHSSSSLLLMGTEPTDVGIERIKAMVKHSDGFKLAEIDLKLRGQGATFGTKQSGWGGLRIGNVVRDQKLLYQLKPLVFELVETEGDLSSYPELVDELIAMFGMNQLLSIFDLNESPLATEDDNLLTPPKTSEDLDPRYILLTAVGQLLKIFGRLAETADSLHPILIREVWENCLPLIQADPVAQDLESWIEKCSIKVLEEVFDVGPIKTLSD